VLFLIILEDRLAQRFIKQCLREPKRDFFGNFSVPLKVSGKLIPNAAEIKMNNRARRLS
jgi:16S rRNA (cytosine1402-N4)-methyltransferase